MIETELRRDGKEGPATRDATRDGGGLAGDRGARLRAEDGAGKAKEEA